MQKIKCESKTVILSLPVSHRPAPNLVYPNIFFGLNFSEKSEQIKLNCVSLHKINISSKGPGSILKNRERQFNYSAQRSGLTLDDKSQRLFPSCVMPNFKRKHCRCNQLLFPRTDARIQTRLSSCVRSPQQNDANFQFDLVWTSLLRSRF